MANQKSNLLERFLHIFVCVGAAVVIFGAMFKILHLSGADLMLKLGLSTEALIFLFYAFLPPDGSHPEAGPVVVADRKDLNNTSDLNQMLNKANINQETLEVLGNNFVKLNETVNTLYESAVFGQEFQQQLQLVNSNLQALNAIYSQEIQTASSQFKLLNSAMHSLDDTTQAIQSMSSDAHLTQQEIKNLTQNISKLNNVYSGMLQAMNVK